MVNAFVSVSPCPNYASMHVKRRTSPELLSSCLERPKSMTQNSLSARDLRMKLLLDHEEGKTRRTGQREREN